jgi:hypothetical protein
MGISLNGLTPAGTYPGLIKTGDNTAISGTPKVLSDGNGNNLPMEVSTTGVNFTNQLQQGGVAVPTQANLAAKQDTLVSGTNIKTINGTSVLGSGNIVTPSTPPSGVAGAIQFSAGSAFNSDAANLFWDDTNNRLGVLTNAPSTALQIGDGITGTNAINLTGGVSSKQKILFSSNGNTAFQSIASHANNGELDLMSNATIRFGRSTTNNGELNSEFARMSSSGLGIDVTNIIAKLQVRGSGSTSATTSLLVQNSAGTELFRVYDNTGIVGAGARFGDVIVGNYVFNGTNIREISVNANALAMQATQGTGVVMGTTTLDPSAFLQVNSTTRGFLPPRMTTLQKNGITSAVAGLVLYDSTTNKLQCYNGSTWNDLF